MIFYLEFLTSENDTHLAECFQQCVNLMHVDSLLVLECYTSTRTSLTSSQTWTRNYIYETAPLQLPSLDFILENASRVHLQQVQILEKTKEAQQTVVAWSQRFQNRMKILHESLQIPDSVKRTWEFYLGHLAACLGAGTMACYQVILTPSSRERIDE